MSVGIAEDARVGFPEGARVVVTGAAGFIGSHLCRALAARGVARIVALDHLGFGSWNDLGPLEDGKTVRVTRDLAEMDREAFAPVLEGADVLFHLAAEKHNNSLDDPQRVLAVNVAASQRLFEAAERAGVAKTVFTSSLYAYGRSRLPAMRESELPKPRTIYGISKLAGEHLLRACGDGGLDTATVRLFFVYGPGQYAGKGYRSVIVSNFDRILCGQPPLVRGDGEQALDYVYVDDAIDALLRAAAGRGRPGPYNVGSGKVVTVNALTRTMLRVAKSDLEPVHVEADWTAGSCRLGDCSRIAADLGWKPRVGLEQGLAHTWEWMKRGGHRA